MRRTIEDIALTALRTARDAGYDDKLCACAFAEGMILATNLSADPSTVTRAVGKVWAANFEIAGPV